MSAQVFPSAKKGALDYRPQLDGIRTFAVGAVLVEHFVGFQKLPGLLGLIDWGQVGVKLFFVLSGFLITGILLRSRETVEQAGVSHWFAARQFYARRFLRIFPLYYFVIAVCVVLNLPPAREILVWLLTYTLNIYVSLRGEWGTLVVYVGHFWSLAVEEQFYIVWPWLLLFIPRKHLLVTVLIVISIGPLWRIWIFSRPVINYIALDMATPACLDALGLGALLALVYHQFRVSKQALQRVLNWLVLPAGLVGSAAVFALTYYQIFWPAHMILFETTSALFFCWLVGSASIGFKGAFGRLLESGPFVYCGRISYGIYVYHPFAAGLTKFVFARMSMPLRPNGWVNFFLFGVVTLIMASLSWYLLEKPLNGLKQSFSYKPKPSQIALQAEPLSATEPVT
jgi:peptidoglycan/LPS O-acetylase OafA/YrhL